MSFGLYVSDTDYVFKGKEIVEQDNFDRITSIRRMVN